MTWTVERVAGPYRGAMGGLAWDGSAMLFSALDEGLVLRFDPARGKTTPLRRYANRTNGIGFAADGALFGCQEGGRRIIQFLADGSAASTATRIDGRIHNHPCDLTIDRRGRVWFSDPHHPVPAYGPPIFPPLEHASVLRLERDGNGLWKLTRVTFDTVAPRAVLLSADERTLYVAEGDVATRAPRELRAYPLADDGTAGAFVVLHTFGADHRGAHRGVEGMCLDGDGNIVACAGSRRSGAGPSILVLEPTGSLLESHPLPDDLPMRCAFGGEDLATLYVTTGQGTLVRIQDTGRRGFRRWCPSGIRLQEHFE
jgi:gluconolactonase